jgi:hypothetical protein
MPEQSRIELPHYINEIKSQEHRRILGEFYDINKSRQWFYRAELIELHPSHMKPTLEIYCNYNPVLEMKDILQFTNKYNIALEIVARSNQG